MNIAINLEDIIKDAKFSNVINQLVAAGNKVYILVDSEANEKNINYLKNNNIIYTDIIQYDSSNQLELLKIKNISYIVDSNLNINSNVPLAHLKDDNYKLNFEGADEVFNHILEYKARFEKHIKDPITVMSGVPSIDKIWSRQYSIDQFNTNLNNLSVYEYIRLNNLNNMDSVALRYFGSTLTFKEMFDKVDEYAKSLKKSGVNAGDVVTICMPNTPEGVIAFFATNKIGAVASMLHPLLKSEDILDTLQKTNSKYMVMADMCYKEVSKIIDKTSLEKVVVVSPADSMPVFNGLPFGIKPLYLTKEFVGKVKEKLNLLRLNVANTFVPKKFVCVKNKLHKEIKKATENLKTVTYDNMFVKWSKEMEFGKDYSETVESVYVPNSAAALLRTGGTTGTSKLAKLTNENIINNTSQLRDTIPSYKKGDELLAISPIFHGFGLVDSVITALAVNMSVDLHPQYNKPIFVQALLNNKPTLVLGVPTLFKSLINNKKFEGKDLEFLKVLISGGDTLSPQLKKEIDEWLKEHNAPNPVFSGIGLTEATAAVAFTGLNSEKDLSVGYPLPLNNVKIINPDTLEELPYGQVGELCISGPTIMDGYYKNDKETQNTFLDENKEWLRTGDMCYLSENGEICFIDRNKNVIIVSGVNVYSNEIETELLQIPEIDSCAVVGIPHQYKMNVPKAYVVLRDGITLTQELKEKILHLCNSKLDSYHKIYEIEQIDKIPLTNLNKVKYTDLREMALKKIEEEKDNEKSMQR